MQISVIIPTFNRPADLNRCLNSIVTQERLPEEVLVVDSGKNVETKKLVERRKNEFEKRGIVLSYIKNDMKDSITAAKNLGVKYSSGDIVSFVDDDFVLHMNYYREVVKVYEAIPSALGVTGYNQCKPEYDGLSVDREILKKLRYISGRLHLISSFNERRRCRVYPSMTVSFPDSSLDRVVSCEWLGGPCTYKKHILEIIRPDENLVRYSWGEDQDLSYRIFKTYPNTLFMTPYAKYWHMKSKQGRMKSRELVYMAEVYDLYLFYKIFDQSFKNKLIHLWGRVGRLTFDLISLVLKPSRSKIIGIKHRVYAIAYCMKYAKNVKEGDLNFFNRMLASDELLRR